MPSFHCSYLLDFTTLHDTQQAHPPSPMHRETLISSHPHIHHLPLHQDLRPVTEMAVRTAAPAMAAAARAPAEAAAPTSISPFHPCVVNMQAITFTASLLR